MLVRSFDALTSGWFAEPCIRGRLICSVVLFVASDRVTAGAFRIWLVNSSSPVSAEAEDILPVFLAYSYRGLIAGVCGAGHWQTEYRLGGRPVHARKLHTEL